MKTEDWKTERITELFCSLTAIDSESFHEKAMAEHLRALLAELGIAAEMDESAKTTGSNCGNLFARVPGTGDKMKETPLLFLAHMDTVAPGNGKHAVIHEDGTITSDGTTVLGADDLSAVAAILEALRELKEENLPHRPLEILFTTAEEAYTVGASAFDFSKVRAKEAFAFDCSDRMGSYSATEPTLLSFAVTVTGRAAHAGFEPEKGVNALLAAARAIARLPLGRPNDHSTLNIGLLASGTGTNVVPERALCQGEIRSLVHEDALALYEETLRVFQEEAAKLGAEAAAKKDVHLTAYSIGGHDAALLRYQKVLEALDIPKSRKVQYGGSDINVVRRLGIDGICIANPMYLAHTTKEYTKISELAELTAIVRGLMVS